MARSWNLIEQNPELKKELALLFQLMGEEEGHKQGVKDREAQGEQNPSSSMQRSGSSAAIQVPGAYGIPQGLYDELNREGAYDYLNADRTYPDPQISQDIVDAYGRAKEPYDIGKASLMDKILMGAGVAGVGVAAFGGNPKVAGTMMGLGYGAARDAPGNYRKRQMRDLGLDLSQSLEKRGQYKAEQGIFNKEQTQDNFMAGMGMQLPGFGLRASEQDMRANKEWDSGNENPWWGPLRTGLAKLGNISARGTPEQRQRWFDNLDAAEYSAIEKDMREKNAWKTGRLDEILRFYGIIPAGSGDPKPTRQPSQETIRKDAGKLFHQEKMGDLKAVGREVDERYPEETGNYGEWLALHDKGSPRAPLSSIRKMLSGGVYGSKKSPNWGIWGDDVITPDSTIQGMFDDVSARDSVGYVDDYEQSGRHLEDFPSKWGLDPATQSVVNPYAPQLPAWATKLGISTVEDAKVHLESVKQNLSPEDYQEARQQLGY